jgi:hypothetical protein
MLSKADAMFPEGQGAPRAFVRDGAAAKRTNELLEIASTAINELFKQRGYDRSLSAVPTLWGRPRAVSELGGGRLPHRSPLGGGRAAYEGAQQP